MEERVLVVLPHPDDEAFGISGTLSRMIRSGAHVTYACLTLGEMGRNMGVPPFANRVTLPEVRRRELEQSCAAIGIQDLRMLGYHDKTIEFENKDKLDQVLASIVEEVKPTLIITFYPGYSVHPDHDATGAAVVRTIGRMPADQRPPVHCVAFAKGTEEAIGKPDIATDVKDFLKYKLASITAHRSQFQAPELVGDKSFENPEILNRFGIERFWTYKFAD